MRSALRSLALIFIVFIPAVVWCQINPNTQINWPQPACANPLNAWFPGSQTCAAAGGGGGGGGGLPVINPAYLGTMTGPNMSVTQATFNTINGWGNTANQFPGASSADQIAAACAAFSGAAGVVVVPYGMADGTPQNLASNCHLLDYRMGGIQYAQGGTSTNQFHALVFNSTESTPAAPNNFTDFFANQFKYATLGGGQYSYGSVAGGYKATYGTLNISSELRTIGQKFPLSIYSWNTSAGDLLPINIYTISYGGTGAAGDEGNVQQETVFSQGNSVNGGGGDNDGSGGVGKGTITAINTSTGVVTYTPVTHEETMGESRIIRDLNTKYSTGTFTSSNSGGNPNTVTITGTGTNWTSIPGFVGTHTVYGGGWTGAEILTSNMVFCADAGGHVGWDFCVPITQGIDATHLTLNLNYPGVGPGANWWSGWDGTYSIYRGAWPTHVDIVNHTFTACNPVVAPSSGTCDVSGLAVGHTWDQAMAYNINVAGYTMEFNRPMGMGGGGGIIMTDYSPAGSPYFTCGFCVDGGFGSVIDYGASGGARGSPTFLTAWKDFPSQWFLAHNDSLAATPIYFFVYGDSGGYAQYPLTFVRDVNNNPGLSLYSGAATISTGGALNAANITSRSNVTMTGNAVIGGTIGSALFGTGIYANHVTHSLIDTGSTDWPYGNLTAGATVTLNAGLDVFGNTTAEHVSIPATSLGGTLQYQNVGYTLQAGHTYQYSIYMQGGAGGEVAVFGLSQDYVNHPECDSGGGTFPSSAILTTSLVRYVGTCTPAVSFVAAPFFGVNSNPSAAVNVYYSQAQVCEVGVDCGAQVITTTTPKTGNGTIINGLPFSSSGGVSSIAATSPIQVSGSTGAVTVSCPTCSTGGGGGGVSLICSGSFALASGTAIASAGVQATTQACSGLLTTDTIQMTFNGDTDAITGYIPSTSGMLTIKTFPTANTINVHVINNTASSITPGAVTVNYRVVR